MFCCLGKAAKDSTDKNSSTSGVAGGGKDSTLAGANPPAEEANGVSPSLRKRASPGAAPAGQSVSTVSPPDSPEDTQAAAELAAVTQPREWVEDGMAAKRGLKGGNAKKSAKSSPLIMISAAPVLGTAAAALEESRYKKRL